MKRQPSLVMLLALAVILSACNSQAGSTSRDAQPTTQVTTMTQQPSQYPKYGHAPDYSWIAGRVSFTRIQGGCTYIVTEDSVPGGDVPTEEPLAEGTVRVGTSVANDTSPPLSEITPAPDVQPQIGNRFTPGGPAWEGAQAKEGDFVVIFGHVAGPNEPREMCPGGTPYVADKLMVNP